MAHSIIQTFKNDYNCTCHPAILQAIASTSSESFTGYGLDKISKRTSKLICDLCACQGAQVHFIAGGTLTNLLSISSFLRPHEAVIAAESGHIEVHETGAIEATGHKIIKANSLDGKITPWQVRALCNMHDNEHMVKPRLVYISQATELGTVYNKDELKALSAVCKEFGLLLFVDGARIGAAIASVENAPNLAELASFCDAFYIGGTKNGALFGEALVLVNDDIKGDFRYLCKQRGALLAKGWVIASQFEALFAQGLYYDLAKHANEMARCMDIELKKLNIPLLIPTCTNQIFPILPLDVVQNLAESYAFETWSKQEHDHTIRFVTSYITTFEAVDNLIKHLKKIL